MNTTSQKFLFLAKQGNIEAINTCLTYILRDLEITVRSSLHKPMIELILDKPDGIPEQATSLKYIKNFFQYLQIPSLQYVRIYAKQSPNNSLAWSSDFYIKNYQNNTNLEAKTQAKPNILDTLPGYIQETKASNITPIAKIEEILVPVNDVNYSHIQNQSLPVIAPNLPSDTGLLISQGAIASSSQMEALAEAKVAIDFSSNTSMVLDQAVTAGGIALGVELAFSGLDNFLAVQRGEKSVEDALIDTLSDSAHVAVTASVITGGVVALSLVFPPVATVGCAVAPVLKIVGVAGGVQRLINILSDSGKVEGIDQLAIFMASYGLDETELDFMDLEADAQLQQMKLGLA